ncbi:hypothetical protein Asppvi_000171 [Aspergillus pseudoviridinutans]|uniref:Asl1-like glycosyl hydrolase catalytic domain-containing protein n=1 Tax=Aspergillus pseudoviridinutans TaxID=1517512 RepID=A0A9P3B0S7_9EURO|nr:uncharacterized protein Asppvi_000171 [Aspergillus pseudoviridinutans]GIJ81672.1 hypothetical protein Asppvi_000171 [Aspergillus pseudoviridinutans]
MRIQWAFVIIPLSLSRAIPVTTPTVCSTTPCPKAGAAYTDPSLVGPLSITGSVRWAYDWDMFTRGPLPPSVEFVPMLHGPKMFSGWSKAINLALANGAKYILGFNEPDDSSQANLSPSTAASYYKVYISPLFNKATLVSPAVTNGEGTNQGLNWMNSFLSCCTDCNIGVVAVHWYGETAKEFKDFVLRAIQLAKQHNIQHIWVTEFALNSDMNGGDSSGSAAFLSEVIPWLNAQNAVSRYAYFMCADGFLLNGRSLNAAGQAYTTPYVEGKRDVIWNRTV